jgi:predicted transcriptional regulator of viral defense system
MARSHLDTIQERFGNRPFRVREAVDVGIPRQAVYRLRDDGLLVSLSRGVMQRTGADPSMNAEFAVVAARAPDATICLNSGLSYWDLSDELPDSLHLAVARGAHWPKIDTPATTLHRFPAETFTLERQAAHTETGEPFWIYSAERCVVDAMRLQRQVGRDVALAALRRYMARDDADPLRLNALARELGGGRQMSQALELILA